MQHFVKDGERIVLIFSIIDECVVSVYEHYNKIYDSNTDDKSKLIECLGEVAMGLGGREGAEEVETIARLAPKSEIALMQVKKYINDSGERHRVFVEEQIERLYDEIKQLEASLDYREVDWGV